MHEHTQRSSRHRVRPSARSRAAWAGVAFALTALVLFAACGGSGASADGPQTVAITSPSTGAQVTSRFGVDLAINFPIGNLSTGRDHVHLYYDGNRKEGEYGIAYSTHFTVTGLSPGMHHIEAVVAHADHTPTDVHSRVITVDVGAGNGGSAPSDTTPMTSGGNAGY
jgi:hypothetical protein